MTVINFEFKQGQSNAEQQLINHGLENNLIYSVFNTVTTRDGGILPKVHAYFDFKNKSIKCDLFNGSSKHIVINSLGVNVFILHS